MDLPAQILEKRRRDDMSEHRLTARPAAWIAILMTGVLLQVCSGDQGPVGSGTRLHAARHDRRGEPRGGEGQPGGRTEHRRQ